MKPLILGRKLQKIPRVILTFDAMYVHCERLRFEEITWTVSFFGSHATGNEYHKLPLTDALPGGIRVGS